MKRLLFIYLLSFCYVVKAQNKFIKEVIGPLQNNQLFFEKVFIHTNKTEYSPNDTIWFKAYVVNNENKPSLQTTLLYVNLLNEKGNIVSSRNVLINKGVGINQIGLNNIPNLGHYYIQAYTNYMRNFGEENYFLQEIKIKGNSSKSKKSFGKDYFVEIVPEGGKLLEDEINAIAVKINDKKTDYTGKIIDNKGKEISKFKNIVSGISRTTFLYERDKEYFAVLYVNDTILKKKIPKAKKKGISLEFVNHKDSVEFKIRKTEDSINKYKLLFHQKNKVLNYYKISSLRNSNENIIISKDNFLLGVNTATLFKNNKPIIERKFFIKNKINKIKIKKNKIDADSITYTLKALSNFNKGIEGNFSVSVLLDDNEKYKLNNSIEKALLFDPYVKNSSIPFNHFLKINKIDLLLLTEKKNHVTLQRMISILNPKPEFNFELGFNLKGPVFPLLTNELALISNKSQLIDKVFLDGNKKFNFKRLLLHKGDTVKMSFLNKKGEAIKPKKIRIDSLKEKEHPKVQLENEINRIILKDVDFSFKIENIKLNEVEIRGKIRSDKYLRKKKFVKKYKKMVFHIGMYEPLKIKEKYRDEEYSLMNFLFREEGIMLKNWKGLEYYLSVGTKYEAVLSIDGKRILSDELPGVSLTMDDIESVAIQPYRGNKFVQVFTTKNYQNNIEELYKSFVLNYGYDRRSKYETPVLDIVNLHQVQELDWKPVLKTNKEGKVFFKIKKDEILENKNIVFVIQGVSNKGELIDKIIRKRY